MFKWPGAPSPRAPEHELADYAELQCWKVGGTSTTTVIKLLDRLAENDYTTGVPEEDETNRQVGAAFEEIERRSEACGSSYPFNIGGRGYTLKYRQIEDHRSIIYCYLLLATRLDMSVNHTYAGIKGTELFEILAAETAREYLGDRADSLVFGTAAGTRRFPAKVTMLCQRMKEGGGYRTQVQNAPQPNDGKLDVVAWKSFRDELEGKIIGFGQCKTGTSYRDTLTQLQPMRSARSGCCRNPFSIQFACSSCRRRLHVHGGIMTLSMLDCSSIAVASSISPRM